MQDLIEPDAGPGNAPEFSVSEISGAIRRVIEGEFGHVRIRGEVGRVSRPRSGHVYLDLKDDRAVLAGVIWKGVAARLALQPEEGLEVIATGRVTTFPGQSKYQVVIEDLQPAGQGALMAMLEKRKALLAAEGLFDAGRKRPLPYLPDIIGVVTSPSGAVIRDILHRLRDRFPRKVLVWPAAVQGERCPAEVIRGIEGFNRMTPGGALPRPDVLIVARGGGSIEDLWGFNDEGVVRAVAASGIPVISAVGHETDTTLIDLVADRRAPTPTAAAELAVPVRHELLAWVDQMRARMSQAQSQALARRGQRLRDLSRGLPRKDRVLEGPAQQLDAISVRLPAALDRCVQRRRVALLDASGSLRPGLLRGLLRQERERLDHRAGRLGPAVRRSLDGRADRLDRFDQRLDLRRLAREMAEHRAAFSRLERRLGDAGGRQVAAWAERLATLDRVRETAGYKATLRRGYAVVRGEDGSLVTTRKAAAAAGVLELEFGDGKLEVGGRLARTGRKGSDRGDPPEQGSLF